jgi:ferrous iron transport protein B
MTGDERSDRPADFPSSPAPRKQITAALAGQPNVGKSTVFNMLTGLTQHVGNWPGKTVDMKVGIYSHNETMVEIVDLPGTCSLTAHSLEERIARDYILKESPDVVIVIANAAALERNLYLMAELLSLPVPVVLGLNMMDVAERQGIQIEPNVLEAALGLPVVSMVASRNQGLWELMEAVDHLVRDKEDFRPSRPHIREDHKRVLDALEDLVAGQVPRPYPENWIALKLLEGDEEITRMMRNQLLPERWNSVHAILKKHEDAILAVAGGRYEWIGRMMRASVVFPPKGQIVLTDRIDRIAAHPFWGFVLLMSIFGLVFWVTSTLAFPAQEWLDTVGVSGAASWLRVVLSGAPSWIQGLVVDGVLAGAGTVLTMLPILAVFFAMLSLLEDSGYLARAAYIMDRFMHPMGLHGKSCLTLCLGFGCNVPAVLGARVIEAERGRLLTILLTPLVPCAARLTVLIFLTSIFFPNNATLVSMILVAFNLLILATAGVIANRLLFKGERSAFIMELPLFHVPNIRTVALSVWQRIMPFLRLAGTLILGVSVLIWFMSVFPGPGLENSILSDLGHFLAPVGRLMGQDWRMMVALMSSFLAKENTIATLGVFFRGGQGEVSLEQTLAGSVMPASALAFLVVQMLFIPCVATVAAIRRETGSMRWTLFSMVYLFVISFGCGIAVYQSAILLHFQP